MVALFSFDRKALNLKKPDQLFIVDWCILWALIVKLSKPFQPRQKFFCKRIMGVGQITDMVFVIHGQILKSLPVTVKG